MVSVDVGFQHIVQFEFARANKAHDAIGETLRHLAGAGVKIAHRVDDNGVAAVRIGHHIGPRSRFQMVKRLNQHRQTTSPQQTDCTRISPVLRCVTACKSALCISNPTRSHVNRVSQKRGDLKALSQHFFRYDDFIIGYNTVQILRNVNSLTVIWPRHCFFAGAAASVQSKLT
ncbi:hypothetical protein MAIT1_00562 [Magnetofaba australis IT-1]|uniref:Uncharacterized protein n=1 Tax=Magnetofaba australis IT-1 TaxID=1434232 RepID=A0A1Y2JZ01_9PROT|nr:hypothetical protein MAIT1_00562 [Magnetofaba australis IT-1]